MTQGECFWWNGSFLFNQQGALSPREEVFTQDSGRQKTSFVILWSDGRPCALCVCARGKHVCLRWPTWSVVSSRRSKVDRLCRRRFPSRVSENASSLLVWTKSINQSARINHCWSPGISGVLLSWLISSTFENVSLVLCQERVTTNWPRHVCCCHVSRIKWQ